MPRMSHTMTAMAACFKPQGTASTSRVLRACHSLKVQVTFEQCWFSAAGSFGDWAEKRLAPGPNPAPIRAGSADEAASSTGRLRCVDVLLPTVLVLSASALLLVALATAGCIWGRVSQGTLLGAVQARVAELGPAPVLEATSMLLCCVLHLTQLMQAVRRQQSARFLGVDDT